MSVVLDEWKYAMVEALYLQRLSLSEQFLDGVHRCGSTQSPVALIASNLRESLY